MTLTDDDVIACLRRIDDPCSVAHGRPIDIVSFGLVDEATGGTQPRVVLRLTDPACLHRVWFIRRVRAEVGTHTVVEFAPADAMWDPGRIRRPVEIEREEQHR